MNFVPIRRNILNWLKKRQSLFPVVMPPPIVVYAATEEDFPSREELEAIQRGIEDIKQGRTFKMRKDESLDDFLNRIEDECNV